MFSFHCPSSEHLMVFAPCSSKPSSQLKLQVEFGRSSVSDSLHCMMRGASLSGFWQRMADTETCVFYWTCPHDIEDGGLYFPCSSYLHSEESADSMYLLMCRSLYWLPLNGNLGHNWSCRCFCSWTSYQHLLHSWQSHLSSFAAQGTEQLQKREATEGVKLKLFIIIMQIILQITKSTQWWKVKTCGRTNTVWLGSIPICWCFTL